MVTAQELERREVHAEVHAQPLVGHLVTLGVETTNTLELLSGEIGSSLLRCLLKGNEGYEAGGSRVVEGQNAIDVFPLVL